MASKHTSTYINDNNKKKVSCMGILSGACKTSYNERGAQAPLVSGLARLDANDGGFSEVNRNYSAASREILYVTSFNILQCIRIHGANCKTSEEN